MSEVTATEGVTDTDNGSSAGLLEEATPVEPQVSLYESLLDAGSPELKGWPMVDSPVPMLVVTLVYFCLTWRAKNIMANR